MSRHVSLRALASLAITAPTLVLTFAAAGAAHADADPSPSPAPPVPASADPSPSAEAGADAVIGDLTTEKLIVPGRAVTHRITMSVTGMQPGAHGWVHLTVPHRISVLTQTSTTNRDPGSVDFSTVNVDSPKRGWDTFSMGFTLRKDATSTVTTFVAYAGNGPLVDTTVTAGFGADGDSDKSDNERTIPVTIAGAASIRGGVWNDLTADSRWANGDAGLPGATVTVYPKDGTKPAAEPVQTDWQGRYEVKYLAFGEYRVTITPPAGSWSFVAPHTGNPEQDSDVTADEGGRTASTGVTIREAKDVEVYAGLIGKAAPSPQPSSSAGPAPTPPTGGATVPTAAPTAAPTATAPAAHGSGSLPLTGASIAGAIAAGAALLTAGVAAILVARRRRA